MKSFEAVALCIGRDAELFADVMGRKAITLRRWKQDPLQSGAPNPVDSIELMIRTALEVERPRSEALAPLEYLQQRFSSDSIPRFESSIHSAFADVCLEISHLTAEYSAAIRDGKIVPDERRRLQRELGHVRERLQALDLVLAATELAEG